MQSSQMHLTASLSQCPGPLTQYTDDEVMMRDSGKILNKNLKNSVFFCI